MTNPEKKWDWIDISLNPNITWETINDNPDYSWWWFSISANPNITWETINDNPKHDWNWMWIATNEMERGKIKWINHLRLKVIATLRIQRYWRKYSSHPEYKLAQRLIHKGLIS